MTSDSNAQLRKKSFQLIILFGLVSLFGDIVYEGARSVNGPYLKTLGANATIVGLIAGIGEFLGYAIRLFSGYFSDKKKAYWLFSFIGYGMLASVPLLALTGIWQWAAFFIVAERIGKAIRSPSRDTIVSQAARQVGTGFGFGLAELLDQIGAITGPLIFTALFLFTGAAVKNISDYQRGYNLFWIPFLLVMACVFIAYKKVPDPSKLEEAALKRIEKDKLSKVFWFYTLFSFITTVGFVNFIIIAYHFKAQNIFPDAQIPFLYAVAMAVDGVIALLIGKTYDILNKKSSRHSAGMDTLIIIPLFSILIGVFAFSANKNLAILSIVFWGIVMGAHETIMRSSIADLTSLKKRGTGYGIFNTCYGLAMFAGSALAGFLYEHSLSILINIIIVVELISIAVFFMMRNQAIKESTMP